MCQVMERLEHPLYMISHFFTYDPAVSDVARLTVCALHEMA